MKLVIGIVRPEKANDVLEALYRAEVRGVSMSRVQGHGGELERVETYRGTTVQMGLSEKVRFEIAVSDEFVDPTIEALCEGARTDEVGDGKIFVVPLERAVRIRTGETDHGAVTPVEQVMSGLTAAASAIDTGDTAWMLVGDRAGPADDPRAGALLRRPGALEEHPQHLHDVRRARSRSPGSPGRWSATRSPSTAKAR